MSARAWGALATVLLALHALSARSPAQCTDDFNDCTTNDVCDGNGTCRGAPVADGTPCHMPLSDCFVEPRCLNGSCTGGTMAKDGTPCRTLNSSCFSVGHCLFGFCQNSNPIECPDDGDPCTSEFCSPTTQRCASFPLCPDAVCAVGRCDPRSATCTYTPIKEGEGCDDFDACTTDEHCRAGDCAGKLVDTPTPTVTPLVSATPTMTPSVPPTVTSTIPPSPTAAPVCAGDCDGDGEVTITDLIVMVNVALGTQAVSACPAGDTGDDGEITIDEILGAVNRALLGC